MQFLRLTDEHPGAKDPDYVTRRDEINKIILNCGLDVPNVQYHDVENECWTAIFDTLTELWPQFACTEFLIGYQRLMKRYWY